MLLCTVVAVAAGTAGWLHVQGEVHPQDFGVGECLVSTRQPESADLEFCHWYSGSTCCLPAADQESFDQFTAAMDLGLECSVSRHAVRNKYWRVREWFCLACDPQEPSYRFSAATGSPLNGVAAQQVAAGTMKFRWRVCKSFVESAWHGDGSAEERNGHLYDQCGIKTQNHCDSQKQVVWNPTANEGKGAVETTTFPVLNGWDPYMCGDNLVVPSKFYQGPTSGEDFLRTLLPPSFEDIPFDFVVVDDTVSDTQCGKCVVDRNASRCVGSDNAVCPAGCVFRHADPANQSSSPSCRGFDRTLTPCFRGPSLAGARLGGAAAVAAVLATAVLLFSDLFLTTCFD